MLQEFPELVENWMRICFHSEYSILVAEQTLARFERFARAHFVTRARDVTEDLVRAFVTAPYRQGRCPAIATQHQRRSVIRLAFRLYSRVDRTVVDPTAHLALPSRSSLAARPVTSDELALAREASLATLVETRGPVIVALAEAGATCSEIASLRVRDVDRGDGTVCLPGARHVLPRWATLTPWGCAQLDRRLQSAGTEPGQLVAYQGSGVGHSGASSVSTALTRILRSAGLGGERDVKVGSVRAFAGRRAFDDTGQIEVAAKILGARSLDATARTIGWDWAGE